MTIRTILCIVFIIACTLGWLNLWGFFDTAYTEQFKSSFLYFWGVERQIEPDRSKECAWGIFCGFISIITVIGIQILIANWIFGPKSEK